MSRLTSAQIRIEWESASAALRSAPVTGPRCPVVSLIARPALVISGDATIAEAAAAMHLGAVSCLLVGHDAGIVTERDVTRAVERAVDPEDAVARIATRHPITVPADMAPVASTSPPKSGSASPRPGRRAAGTGVLGEKAPRAPRRPHPGIGPTTRTLRHQNLSSGKPVDVPTGRSGRPGLTLWRPNRKCTGRDRPNLPNRLPRPNG